MKPDARWLVVPAIFDNLLADNPSPENKPGLADEQSARPSLFDGDPNKNRASDRQPDHAGNGSESRPIKRQGPTFVISLFFGQNRQNFAASAKTLQKRKLSY